VFFYIVLFNVRSHVQGLNLILILVEDKLDELRQITHECKRMSANSLASSESPRNQLRRLIVPNWLWQCTWLRHLPSYYRSIPEGQCPLSRWRIYRDMLWIFFRLGRVPEHYGPYRLWERPRSEWALCFGSPYPPLQRARFARRVYPYEYEILYNDKVVGAKLCQTLDVRQPRIFGIVNPGEPYRQRIAEWLDNEPLMLKPVYGRSGLGIVRLERNPAGEPQVRTPAGVLSLNDLQLEVPCFVQEVIRQDSRIAAIWNSSVNTMRVTTMLRPSGEVIIIACMMRFGVGESFVDNWSAGGVAVGIDPQTGKFRSFGADMHGHHYAKHPSSGFTFEGFEIPEWQRILDTARKVQTALPFSKMLGLDICLDESGTPVLIEINGLPDFTAVEQLNGPLLANEQVRAAFAEYGLVD